MITLTNILESISNKLGDKFNDVSIYTEEVKKGLKKPSFFIAINPVNTDNLITYKEKVVNIDISFFSLNETNGENLEMINLLENLLSTTLAVLDRKFTIDNLNFNVVDKTLHCNFSIDFADNNEFITITTPNGETVNIPMNEVDSELGYTPDTITTMQELEIEEV
jgi:hypothetical protein